MALLYVVCMMLPNLEDGPVLSFVPTKATVFRSSGGSDPREENGILWHTEATLELRASGTCGKFSFPWLWTKGLRTSRGQCGNAQH